MKKTQIQTLVMLAAGALALCGCYSYPPPPAATEGNTFLNRKTDKTDDLLRDIRTLTIDDAQRIGAANNPSYISVYHAVNAARMRYYQALGAWSPTLNANFSLGHANNWSGTQSNIIVPDYTGKLYTNTTLSAGWLVFNGFARELDILIADRKFDYQKAIDENTCRTLLRSISFAYNDILLAQEKIRIADKNMSFQMDCLRETELKNQVGTAALSDVLNFQIQVNNAENDQITAEYTYQLAVYALAVLMGYPDGTLPDWITFPDINSEFADNLDTVEVYLDSALANRPDLRGYRELLKVSEYSYKRSFSTYYPSVSLFANFSYATQNTRYRGNYVSGNEVKSTSSSGPGFEYGFSANWTLFNGFIRYNQVREAKANLAAAQFNVATQWLTVVQEVRNAYTRYVISVRQARLYEKTLKYSTEQRDLVSKEYEAGNIGITRLNEVQRDLVSAQTTLATAYIDIQNAKIQLDAATGQNIVGYYVDPDTRYVKQQEAK